MRPRSNNHLSLLTPPCQQGPAGPAGIRGVTGPPGVNGQPGLTGADGLKGSQGRAGEVGDRPSPSPPRGSPRVPPGALFPSPAVQASRGPAHRSAAVSVPKAMDAGDGASGFRRLSRITEG